VGPDGKPLVHRRGAGDEEDYVTPERHERAVKRIRIEAGEDAENDAPTCAAKRVKWDRGLYNTVYFDDEPGPLVVPKPPNTSKSALAGSAKTLRLDNLGNMLNSSSPIKGLFSENVVVKRFVYDDDEEAKALAASPTPPESELPKGKRKTRM